MKLESSSQHVSQRDDYDEDDPMQNRSITRARNIEPEIEENDDPVRLGRTFYANLLLWGIEKFVVMGLVIWFAVEMGWLALLLVGTVILGMMSGMIQRAKGWR